MTMISQLIAVAFVLHIATEADAFGMVPRPRFAGPRSTQVALKSTEDGRHIAVDPMAGESSKPVDMARAKDCADHFGKCSVEEIEALRDGMC